MPIVEQITVVYANCDASRPIVTPQQAFAIPVSHYLDHFEQSGAQAMLDTFFDEATFHDDPSVRAKRFGALRDAMMQHPVDADLLATITDEVTQRFGPRRVRLRSSSTAEYLSDVDPALVSARGEIVGEPRALVCALRSIHEHFHPLLDPDGENPWFAMKIELKLTDGVRDLMINQTRPYDFGRADIPNDCRQF